MANPVLNSTTLVTQAAPYQVQICGSTRTQQILLILAMVLELKGIGGTDYTVNGIRWTQLQTDAQQLEIGESEDQIAAGRINLAFINAAAAGATVPDTLTGKLNLLGQLLTTDQVLLDKIQLLVQGKLGVHKAYNQ